MLQRSLIGIAWIAVIALALWLRVDDLEARPIHFDEATGAHIFSERLADRGYQFDPTHYHGPFLSLSTVPLAALYGEHSWRELSLTMLRTGPVLAGMLLVLTPLLWLRRVGHAAALAAAALLASSPLLVYYNRMYIHESWLALFGMLTAAAVFYLIESPTRKRALLAGAAAGLMFATKETTLISLASWSLAGAVCWGLRKYRRGEGMAAPHLTAYFGPAAWFTLSLFLTAAVFYTEGFREPGGMVDAIRTYFVYETTPGHDKAFTYYLQMLVWPKQALGMWWSESGIVLLGTLACIPAVRSGRGLAPIAFIGLGALFHVLVYSLISYKTPWLMTLPWALACLLAGCAFLGARSTQTVGKTLSFGLAFAICLFTQIDQSIQANGRLANHADNPYAYVPTSRNITQLPGWLQQLEGYAEGGSLEPIVVVGRGYWPLPWYLRDFKKVGYWPDPPEELASRWVVLSMPEQARECNRLLEETHTQLPRTLRSNVPITLYLKNELWKAWTENNNG
jgi:uncharacterized protein (TIGR03663 family)